MDPRRVLHATHPTIDLSYNGYCDDYCINLKLTSSNELTIEAEQRRTHQIYNSSFANEKCSALTESMFRTNDELYEYLKFLMENNCDVKDERNPQKLTAAQSNTNLELKVTTAMILGANKTINRSFQLSLVKIKLEDIARLENIINDLYRRVEDLETRVVPREQCVRLKGLKFQKPTNTAAFTFMNNDRTCFNGAPAAQRIVVIDRPFADKQGRYQKVDFVWNTAINASYVGMRKGLPTNETDIATNSDDRCFFYLPNGTLYSKEKSGVAYIPGTFKQGQRVSVILDTESMRLAFAVDDVSLTWAYELRKTVQLNELYVCVILHNQNESVSIVE
ncbi:unnamed protein product [Adineta steineri]|uniref:B30.2/SPRY domain-containing protein n=1 Tax=Adineta steineri TaxID=433720 RepID=A0A815EPS5_9BILA|nr:unnamed protein product [Adineta steineri]CAF3824840.1 unnamed protein product [Adineta steineri]